MRTRVLSLLGALSLLASASPVLHQPIIHERRDLSSKWAKITKPHRGSQVHARIGLAQSNLERGEASLLDISDPSSSEYGKHWTSDLVKEIFAPSAATVQGTLDWLSESGISVGRVKQTSGRGALTFTATIDELNKLFQTDYYLYEHPELEGVALGCDEYYIPAHLRGHIDFINPGTGLEGIQKGKPKGIAKRDDICSTNGVITLDFKPFSELPQSFPLDRCFAGLTPDCIKALYKVPMDSPCHHDSTIGIFAMNASYVQEDLDLFFQYFSSKVPSGARPDFVSVNGPNLSTSVETVLNFEANLDLQMALPLVYPQNVSFYDIGPSPDQVEEISRTNLSDPTSQDLANRVGFGNLLSAFDKSYCNKTDDTECGTSQAPKVLSISYGPSELFTSEALARSLCSEFMKLGLQGTTVLVSSGDGGLAPQLGMCYGPKDNIFNPSVLASCPWVTAVGGTELADNHSISSYGAEIVANESAPGIGGYSPGSGFSNYFKVPKYQKRAVDGYFKEHPSPYPSYNYDGLNCSIGANGGLYNAGGRAYPDISAVSASIYTVAGGCFGLDGGTSYAAPIVAGIISRLNSERLEAGKTTIGFLNPLLYAHPEVLNDVTRGHNYGCGTQGFPAATGWDIVTGLGTPNYPKMKRLFMSLP